MPNNIIGNLAFPGLDEFQYLKLIDFFLNFSDDLRGEVCIQT